MTESASESIVGRIPGPGTAQAIDSDESLVLRAQRGDRPAFEQLVRQTARMLFSRIYLETGDTHRAEDLVQETFLHAWRSIAQITDPAGFRPWLCAVAKSVTADAYRHDFRKKRSASRRADLQDVAARLADASPGPPEQAEREEGRRRVLSLLRSLPEEYSLPLTLRYIGGADYETIGRQLGISNGSLRGLLNRGMAKLREKLK